MNKVVKTPVISAARAPSFKDFERFGTPIGTDWHGSPPAHPPEFLFWLDERQFFFLARQKGSSGRAHPESRAGSFREELWKHDVAEFFLGTADGSTYLEFNLAPNGAWWSCLFQSPRNPAPGHPQPIPGVVTQAKRTSDSWEALARLPRPWLEELFPFDQPLTLNATFILESPAQIFLTSADLGDGEPDFHRPDRFPGVKLSPLT